MSATTNMGSVYKRGSRWWISYYHPRTGRRYRESSGSELKKDATALLRKRNREMGEGKPVGPDAEKMTVENLKELHTMDLKANGKRTKWAKTAWKHVTAFFEGFKAVDITSHRLRAYVVHRQKQEAANSSIQKELAVIRRSFNLAADDGRIGAVPKVPSVEVDNVRTNFVTLAEVERICSHLSRDLSDVVRFAAWTAWRKGEILGLTWADVDFDAGEVRLPPGTTKNKDGRTFQMHKLPPLEAMLRDRLERTRSLEREQGEIYPHVFTRKDGKPIKSMRGAWNNACRLAGCPDAHFHDLRRTGIRNFERAGISRSTAMTMSGHRTMSVYNRYAISDKKAQEEGVEKLAAFLGHGPDRSARKVVPIEEAKEA